MRITKNDVRLLTNEATYNGGYTIALADVLGRYVVGGLKTVTAKIGDALNQAESIAERLGESVVGPNARQLGQRRHYLF